MFIYIYILLPMYIYISYIVSLSLSLSGSPEPTSLRSCISHCRLHDRISTWPAALASACSHLSFFVCDVFTARRACRAA